MGVLRMISGHLPPLLASPRWGEELGGYFPAGRRNWGVFPRWGEELGGYSPAGGRNWGVFPRWGEELGGYSPAGGRSWGVYSRPQRGRAGVGVIPHLPIPHSPPTIPQSGITPATSPPVAPPLPQPVGLRWRRLRRRWRPGWGWGR
ncbi:MAG: hypothetical protein KatS3mg056_0299 [Chloroflexus sp.]|nr:MAG: hypothetical protein KatS3mg056_0299 [Chloroflexus sp.]